MGTRRKTLANSLTRGLEVAGSSARALLESAGIRPERRGETLSIDEWIALSRRWLDGGGGAAVGGAAAPRRTPR